MMRQVKRYFRKLNQNLLNVTRSTDGGYFIAGFIVIGILIFATLHTMFAIMATKMESKQTGYFDLYLENLSNCWESSMANKKIQTLWQSELELVDCPESFGDMKNFSQLLLYKQQSLMNVYNSTGIRQAKRIVLINRDIATNTDEYFPAITSAWNSITEGITNEVHEILGTQQKNETSSTCSAHFDPQLIKAKKLSYSTQPHQQEDFTKYLDAGVCIATGYATNTIPATTGSMKYPILPTNIRCIPSFLIIGAMKSGTGELMKWLNLHPFLSLGSNQVNQQRESHFLTNYVHKHHSKSPSSSNKLTSTPTQTQTQTQKRHLLTTTTTPSSPTPTTSSIQHSLLPITTNKLSFSQEYLSTTFPSFSLREALNEYTYEKSPDYLRNPMVLEFLAAMYPSMMLIIQLRNPSIRAISEFMHHNRHGRYLKLLHDVTIPLHPTTTTSTATPEMKDATTKGSTKSEKKKKEHLRKDASGSGVKSTGNATSAVMYKKYKKGRILRDYHTYTTSDRISTLSTGGSSKTTTNPIKFMEENDDFHIDIHLLKTQDYVILPYPCDVHDMMHYFLGTPNRMHTTTVSTAAKSTSSYLFGKGESAKKGASVDVVTPPTTTTTMSTAVSSDGKEESTATENVLAGGSSDGKELKRGNSTVSVDGKSSMSSEEDLLEIAATIDKQQTKGAAEKPSTSSSTGKGKGNSENNKKDNNVKTNSEGKTTSPPQQQQQQQQQQSVPKEILNGYYDLQLLHVFKYFPARNILILLQEEMARNTFRTLRRVESFLSIPCFDYSSVAMIVDPQEPPVRKPTSFNDKLQHYRSRMKKLLGLSASTNGGSLSSDKIFRLTSPAFQRWMNELYAPHNQQVVQLLGQYDTELPHVINVQDAKWSLPN